MATRATRRSASARRGASRKTDKRAPFAGSLPRATKVERGRTAAPSSIPANIRAFGVELLPEQRAYIRRKLGMKLGKFAPSIERVSVRMEDVNGPRGGVDHACRMKVVLSELPSVVFEERDASLPRAIDGAITGVERAVRRAVGRRRMNRAKPARRAGRRVAAS